MFIIVFVLVGVSRIDRVKNEERRRAGIERELMNRADHRGLRRFGHVEGKNGYRMARTVLMADVSEGRVRGRLRLGWMDGMNVALDSKGMTVKAVRKIGRKEWRTLVHMWNVDD